MKISIYTHSIKKDKKKKGKSKELKETEDSLEENSLSGDYIDRHTTQDNIDFSTVESEYILVLDADRLGQIQISGASYTNGMLTVEALKGGHSGIDIGGPNLGDIKASNSGKVIYSGWYGGYGKVVIIEHGIINGKPVTTLYAHMSSIAVSNGTKVSKGQVIGYEGTTGYSTGPHCHFEVRVNGQPNNPLNYI